jgi:hypothetical protein
VTRELWRDTQVDGYGHGSEGDGGGWPGLRQVVLVRTTRVLACGPDPAPVTEDHYYLSSLEPNKHDAARMLHLIRSHWLIENELHHIKDRSMAEDAQRHRPGATAAARLRSIAVGLYRLVRGPSVPAKQTRLRARPKMALRLLRRRGKGGKVL